MLHFSKVSFVKSMLPITFLYPLKYFDNTFEDGHFMEKNDIQMASVLKISEYGSWKWNVKSVSVNPTHSRMTGKYPIISVGKRGFFPDFVVILLDS